MPTNGFTHYTWSVDWANDADTGDTGFVDMDFVPPSVNMLTENQIRLRELQLMGRPVIYDPTTDSIFELIDGEVRRIEDAPRATRKPKQKKAPVLDLDAIRFELEDVLLHLMKGQPTVMQRDYISYAQDLGMERFRHNYERRDAENQRMYYIKYKNKIIAHVQAKPHKSAVIFKQTEPKYLLIQRLLEKVIYYCLPEMKVKYQ